MADSMAPRERDSLEKLLEVVYLFHGGDRNKVDQWLRSGHPNLGGEAPLELIRTNRMDVLVDLLRMMVAEMENRP